MIKSQRPMMLNSAVNLSKLVQEQEVVSWGNIKSVEKYVNSLKEAVEALAAENNLLTSYHNQILEKVNNLHKLLCSHSSFVSLIDKRIGGGRPAERF